MNLGGITLVNNLDYKIRIAKLQRQAITKSGYPLITINLRYLKQRAIFDSRQHILTAALSAIESAFNAHSIPIVDIKFLKEEAYPIVLVTPAHQHVTLLKKLTMAIENHHPLGPMMDINVMGLDGISITRRSTGIPPRVCMVCGESVSVCVARGKHSNKDYLDAMNELVLNEKFSHKVTTESLC